MNIFLNKKRKDDVYTLFSFREALVALISRWNQNFRRTVGPTFSAFHDWSIDLGQMQMGCKWYTYQRNETVFFFSWEFDRVCFQKFPKENQSKIVYFYSVINEYPKRYNSYITHPFLLALRRRGRFARRNVCDSAAEIPYWWCKSMFT